MSEQLALNFARYADGARQPTSRAAYKAEVKPTLGERQRAVLFALDELGPSTNSEIARFLNKPINTITPRVHELRHTEPAPLVVLAGQRACSVTSRTALVWRRA